MNAKSFLEELERISGIDFLYNPKANTRIGVKMGDIFKLAKKYINMPLNEVEKLLTSDIHEAKVGAVSILDFIARDKKINDDTKKKIYDLYINKHEFINTWDLVDRAAPYVIGGYLYDKSRKPLYDLASSKQPMERRTAIVATYYFIRQNDIDDTFEIAHILADDTDEYVQLAVGSWIREAGKKDKARLIDFLKGHKGLLSKRAMSYGLEKLSIEEKEYIKSS